MLLIEEVVNHDEGNASHVFTNMILDSVFYSFNVSSVMINGVAGMTAADQQRIKDSVLKKTSAFPERVDTTLLHDFDLIYIDISDWQLSGNTLTFWENLGIGDMDPAFIGRNCADPNPYPTNSYWDWAMEARSD